MRKIFLLLVLLLPLCSCQQQYEKEIEEYYQTHLNDPDSYELVYMSDRPQVLTPSCFIVFEYENDEPTLLLAELDKFIANCKVKGKDHNEHIGYYVEHEYRAKNKFGAMVLQKDRIFFNKELTHITHVERIEL